MVIHQVCKITGYTQDQILGRLRYQELITARTAVAIVLKEQLHYSLAKIGVCLGRDHSSICSNISGKKRKNEKGKEKRRLAAQAIVEKVVVPEEYRRKGLHADELAEIRKRMMAELMLKLEEQKATRQEAMRQIEMKLERMRVMPRLKKAKLTVTYRDAR